MEAAALQISRLCWRGHVREAIAAFYALKSTHPSSSSIYSTLFHGCARHGLLAEGQALHHHMLSSPPISSSPADLVIYNHLINMYCKCAHLVAARQVFDGMPERNLVSWTALVTGYAQKGKNEECFRLFSNMVGYHLPNDFAISGVLSSCANVREGGRGRQVHALALKISFDEDVCVGNALITMYSRCYGDGDVHGNDGWSVFRMMMRRNSITWNSMIAGFQMNGKWDCSLGLFACMLREGVAIDRAALVSVLPACSSLRWCWQLHAVVIKTSFALEVEVATALVQAYSGVGVEGGDCFRVFLEARRKDIMSWNGIITSCAERDPEKSISLFCQMRLDGLDPDSYTFSTVVKACAGLATERHGSAIHSLIVRSGFESDVVLGNALIHAYARSGNIHLAESVFERMVDRGVVSWNSMIKGYAMHGRAKDALRLFSNMNLRPDSATFVALLSACSHAGLVDEGKNLFKSMTDDYGINPQVDHYACMVDILGRVGLLLEAEELISQMPMKPDSVVWSALLGACLKHKETDIGGKAAQKLMELEPRNSVGYVMMSNIFCAGGSFHEAALIRKGMKDWHAKKEVSLSWIEINNRVHEFAVGGQRHPEIDVIYAEVKRLSDQLKEIGYVADTSFVLHEIKEEYKEEQLLQHSEKLALTFGLMSVSPAQSSIKIMKNIRTCPDCHNFMKLTSQWTKKEIILRDANRFHHFKDGICSCGDYW